ncbi:PREDICTED: uncharacterized protein LOC108661427 [Theobroma cacao]|uniref:Uncharacterized protein LOC108661427 n=1 Tax=Theobroma cacao TaxID=3641 RepID=A0AB32W6P9_THECC|nr:PREDICTED: uncharacterized protein LOC108661427 [Theobroma cacao]
MAEYEALVMGLQAAIERKADAINVYGDSALVICQMRGEWETRDSKLVPYKKLVTELSKQFKEISFNHLPREENQIADALATLAAMFKIKEVANVRPFDLEVREVSAHCLNVEEEVDGRRSLFWCGLNPFLYSVCKRESKFGYVADKQVRPCVLVY